MISVKQPDLQMTTCTHQFNFPQLQFLQNLWFQNIFLDILTWLSYHRYPTLLQLQIAHLYFDHVLHCAKKVHWSSKVTTTIVIGCRQFWSRIGYNYQKSGRCISGQCINRTELFTWDCILEIETWKWLFNDNYYYWFS